MLVLAACTAPIIPVAWFYIEESLKLPVTCLKCVNDLWYAMRARAVYQIVLYTFFSSIFANFSYTAGSPIQLYMHGLNWNWRTMTVLTGALVIVVGVASGINFLIGAFVTVELIGEGHEGAMYGLLAIVAILSSPFAATLTKVVDNWLWGLSNERVQVDDYTVRRDVTEAVLLMYGMSVVSWLFLFLLPRQMETQDLKHDGGSSTLFARGRCSRSKTTVLAPWKPADYDVFRWIEWCVMDRMPVSFCERPLVRKNAKMEPISAATLQKYIDLLYTYVRDDIALKLSEKFGVVIRDGRHFIVMAVFDDPTVS
ncbi:hypothetical protein F441_03858 [Phytophthora nicotianae CJ01A1]|uniref:Uncharacterized protein n=1 Tax=Phytophthora nicotianae CJ01A1 TaxID=1317063 RepID=W2XKB0_PHYNI|nr:hypothetical protein F441_03858 [Phytophthora nicotianae CJ01A1]